ncbi:MAG: hypothetical protein GYB66_02080 [Chloroflexi bacterium]|nr:hypothetical protein [Chloroflexota bacterium]
MKRAFLTLAALFLVLMLSACSGEVFDIAYTARGDSTNLLAVTKTDNFQRTDDVNVVVKLSGHDGDVEVQVKFINPEGGQEGETLTAVVPEDVGTVVLGLDWEQRPSQEPWEAGSWSAEVYVDGEMVHELEYRVN